MELGLVLKLAVIAAEVFQDERRDRFNSALSKIQKEWHEEMDKPESDRSDFELDRLLRDARDVFKRIIEQHSKK